LTLRLAKESEVDNVCSLYESVKKIGKEKGNTDWDDSYPNREIVIDDIKNRYLFIYEDCNKIIGTVTMIPHEEIDITPNKWKIEDGCFLTRLCVNPEMQNSGMGEAIMREVTKYAKSIGINATHHLASIINPAANRLYARMKYDKRGQVHLYDHDYYAYEMIISNIS
jgi:GNAT superfamily N-acetyltransferase